MMDDAKADNGLNAGSTAETKAAIAETRRALTQAIAYARQELVRDEDDHRRTQELLQRVLDSRGRRWILRVRRRLLTAGRLLVLPWRGLQWVMVGLARLFARPARISDLISAVRYQSLGLRDLQPVEQVTNQPDPAEAVRWLEKVVVAGRSRHALFCHPDSSLTVQIPDAAGSAVSAYAALLPFVWESNPDGVEFSLSARSEDGSWRCEARRHIHPHTRPGDRRWRRLRVRVPGRVTSPLLVTFATRLRQGDRSDSAWAIWGDPTLDRPRSLMELARAGHANVRQVGFAGALAKLLDFGGRDEEQARFRRWLDVNTPAADALAAMAAQSEAFAYKPLISVITPVYNTDPRWLIACIESVRRQAYPNWELCLADDASTSPGTAKVLARYANDPRIRITRLARNQHISAASNAALAQARGEFVAMLDHDDELAPDAFYEMARRLNETPDADFLYSDEDKLDMSGQRCEPYFKPDWTPDMFRSFMYTNHLMLIRRSLVEAVGGFRVGFEGSQDYDLVLRVIERTDRVVHVPKILYHWRKIPGSAAAVTEAKPWALKAAKRALAEHLQRRNVNAEVVAGHAPGLFRVRYRIRGTPLVTIVVTTDDRTREVNGRDVRLLVNCLRSVVQKTSYKRYEILVIDNGTLSEESAAFLARTPHRRVSYAYEGAFNFSSKLNFSVQHARGEHLVIFNDDLEIISSEWMSAMLEFSQQPEIGAVGAKLLFPDGRLQHIGMVLGVCGVAAHAYHMAPASSSGYAGGAHVIRNFSCVTGACLMTRRAVFDEVGGFDEGLAIDFNDVDYCLRLRRAGYRIVYTPYAQLYHLESGSHGGRQQARSEQDEMRRRWPEVIARDPYYNPNLTRDFPDHRIGV